jgi:hypothetical protein
VEYTAISRLLKTVLLIPMVALWAFHLSQRRFKNAGVRKRIATLSLTLVLIGAWGAAWLFDRFDVPDFYLVFVAAAAVVLVAWQRKRLLPYRLRCVQCGKTLSFSRMLSWDSNKCEACEPPVTEGDPHR